MKRELGYFRVDGDYGWNQDKFEKKLMCLGGCAIVTACDCCVYLKKFKGHEKIYPFPVEPVKREEYLRVTELLHPYLHPRRKGVDTLTLFINSFEKYLAQVGEQNTLLEPFDGDRSVEEAKGAVRAQIDGGFPVPCLILNHKHPDMEEYVWHWFVLSGYDDTDGTFSVKAVTYGTWSWIDFDKLWDTGNDRKGGLVLLRETGMQDTPTA